MPAKNGNILADLLMLYRLWRFGMVFINDFLAVFVFVAVFSFNGHFWSSIFIGAVQNTYGYSTADVSDLVYFTFEIGYWT